MCRYLLLFMRYNDLFVEKLRFFAVVPISASFKPSQGVTPVNYGG